MPPNRAKWIVASLMVVAVLGALPLLPVDSAYLKENPAHWSSVLPPLCAIGLAFASRRILPSLAVAILLGGFLAVGFHPLGWVEKLAVDYFWKPVTGESGFKTWILVFTASLIGMVKVVSRMGGNLGLVNLVEKIARGARGTRLATGLLGTAIFFDDYTNTIVVGTTMRPLTDRWRVSREKLAYLVDSTAAPVAGLAVVSTWIGYEVGLFAEVARTVGLELDGYAIFFQALPYRFYCIFALVFVFANALLGRDFGPMWRAENRAAVLGQVSNPLSAPAGGSALADVTPAPGAPPRAANAIVPVCIVLVLTMLGMLWDGNAFKAPSSLLALRGWQEAFGQAENSTRTLAVAALGGSAVALALAVSQQILSVGTALKAWGVGVGSMGWVILLLILAWGIGAVTADLSTAHYLVALVKGKVSAALLPLITFVLAGLIAFATGTSWGTMAILIPTAGPLAYQLGDAALCIICLAAVLDGAIFGDHCSPISDTTVMSSIASSCDHLDHVKTQLPYALVTAVVALACGYFWTASGMAPRLAYPIGIGAIVTMLLLVGKPVGTVSKIERSK